MAVEEAALGKEADARGETGWRAAQRAAAQAAGLPGMDRWGGGRGTGGKRRVRSDGGGRVGRGVVERAVVRAEPAGHGVATNDAEARRAVLPKK